MAILRVIVVLLFCGLLCGYFCWGLPRGAQAQSGVARRILIDGSGSMTGFFVTGEVEKLHKAILSAQPGAGIKSKYFVDENLIDIGDSYAPPNGAVTLLENALRRTLETKPLPAIVWFVTDNQASAGGETQSDQDIKGFYRELHSDRIKRIYLFPLRLKFKGKLYREDGRSVLKGDYDGLRGLLVYGLLLDDAARAEFDQTINNLRGRLEGDFGQGNVSSIFVKPLQRDTVEAELISGRKLKFEKNRIFGRDFVEGEPIDGEFKLALTSRLGQINIKQARIDVRQVGRFRTNDFFEKELNSSISPTEIENFGPGRYQKQFTIRLRMDAVHMDGARANFWKTIFRNHGDIEGEIQVAIHVPRENFRAVPELLKSFSTNKDIYRFADPVTQSKVFKLEELVQDLIPGEEQEINPRVGANLEGRIPVHLQVRLPKAAMWLLILLILGLMVIPVAAAVWVRRQPRYRLTWGDGSYRACDDFHLWPFAGRAVEMDGRRAAIIKKSLSGIKVSAMPDYDVDGKTSRLLNRYGTDFGLSRRSDGVELSFYFSQAGALARKPSAPSGDIFGDGGYGADSKDGDGVIADAPPTRKPVTGAGAGSNQNNRVAEDGNVDIDSLFR